MLARDQATGRGLTPTLRKWSPLMDPAWTATGHASMHFPILVVDHHFASSLPRERQADSLGALTRL